MVAAVATLDPAMAENTPQDMMLVCNKPPGKRPTHTFKARYNRSDKPARNMISPISKNKGTDTSTKLVDGAHSISPMKFQNGRSDKPKPASKANTAKAAPMYTPPAKKATKASTTATNAHHGTACDTCTAAPPPIKDETPMTSANTSTKTAAIMAGLTPWMGPVCRLPPARFLRLPLHSCAHSAFDPFFRVHCPTTAPSCGT